MRTAAVKPAVCPECGASFDHGATACGQSCPHGASCRLWRCPNCGCEFRAESPLVRWLRRLCRRAARPPARPAGTVICLTELETGERSTVVEVVSDKPSRRNALAVFGLVPGSEVVLQQKRPAYLLRVGETELALEADLAREILVTRSAPAADQCPAQR